MQHIKYLALVFCMGVLFACSKNEAAPTSPGPETVYTDASTQLDVSYGDDAQEAYDIYLPANRSTSKTKVIILIHGGAWIEGDKENMAYIIPTIRQQLPDHAIVNMNYVLASPPYTPAFPNQFEDVQAVIKQLTDQSTELGIKPQFALIGASAGAHLSLQYDYVYDVDDQVKMVASIVGPTNLADAFYSQNPDFALALPFMVNANAYPDGTDLARAVSPAYNVSTQSSPTIMFYGNQDPLVPVSNPVFLKNKLDAASVENKYTLYEGGHGDWSTEDQLDMQAQLFAFIKAHLAIE
ncbi:MAG: alpha/beta hydrolase [Cytophagaceae bacterium]|nr:alpha/beta hydrolase [Cytophagaceae bacterium]|tara:strand:+ start:2763 stop:3647 length:885 start_codon:yes stop_codon:yes gene_type:complete